jgi:hypothetical protein
MGALSGVAFAALVIDEASCRVRKGPAFRVADTRPADGVDVEHPAVAKRTRAEFTWLESTASSSWLADSRSGPVYVQAARKPPSFNKQTPSSTRAA